MVQKCCIEGCTRGWLDGKLRGFHFPLKSRPDIAAEWIKFVGKENWTPTGNNALCYEHFENTLHNPNAINCYNFEMILFSIISWKLILTRT